MRKTLLLFCVFANMVNAQILPDSIYTYKGSNKILYGGAAINYDESGRKILEKGMINSNGDDILNEEDREYKIEYTYTEMGDMLKKEETESHFENEKWKDYIKTVQVYNISNINVSVQSDIYPNPVSDVLYVTLEGADNAVITLVNMAGSVVLQQKTSHPSTSIPVQSFAKGFYFLTVKTDKGIKTHKVIIR